MSELPPPDHAQIERAARLLAEGGLVAVPTETVYGLAANADDASAVRASFAAKRRPTSHPLIVHLRGAEDLPRWCRQVPAAAWRLSEAFWPGPLTMVLPRGERCGDVVTGGQDTVAVRAPSHPWTRELLRLFAGPTGRAFTAPSANTFGRVSPTRAEHVAADLGLKPEGALDMILDGGPCPIGVESTIVDLSRPTVRVLRPGAITAAMIADALGVPVPDDGPDPGAPRVSGSLRSHYAPRAPARLVSAEELLARCRDGGQGLAVLARPAILARLGPGLRPALAIAANAAVEEYQRSLYDWLRRLDTADTRLILIERPPAGPAWAAVNDRLRRATAGT